MSHGDLMIVVGPSAVGKMTVGRAVCDRTDPATPLAADRLLAAHRHLRVDNSGPDPVAAAERIVVWHAGAPLVDQRAPASDVEAPD